MTHFICFSKGKEQKDYKGKSLGIGPDRALYYSKSLGKRRVYRSSYPEPPVNPKNDLVLFIFDAEQDAVDLCKTINDAYNDDFTIQPHA